MTTCGYMQPGCSSHGGHLHGVHGTRRSGLTCTADWCAHRMFPLSTATAQVCPLLYQAALHADRGVNALHVLVQLHSSTPSTHKHYVGRHIQLAQQQPQQFNIMPAGGMCRVSIQTVATILFVHFPPVPLLQLTWQSTSRAVCWQWQQAPTALWTNLPRFQITASSSRLLLR